MSRWRSIIGRWGSRRSAPGRGRSSDARGSERSCDCCAPVSENPAALAARKIAEFGWAVIGVAECGADREPVMAYTVGMIENFGHPELIIFGVPAKIAATVLNVLGASFVSTGHTVPIDVPLENLFCRHPIVAKMARVDLAALYALLAAERAQTKGHRLSAVQLVWPDIKGHFPWEAAYDESLDRLQPRLFESSGR